MGLFGGLIYYVTFVPLNNQQITFIKFIYIMENFMLNIVQSNENITKIENQLFDVVMIRLSANGEDIVECEIIEDLETLLLEDTIEVDYQEDFDYQEYFDNQEEEVLNVEEETTFDIVNWFGVFKSTGGTQLGVVGNRFAPTQPRAVFMAFCDAILEYGLDTAKMRYTEVKGGEIVRFSIDLEPISFINKFGLDDETIPTLNLQIGLNGKTPTSMFITTLRTICLNGAKKSFTEFQTSFKNVKGNKGKIVGMFNDVVRCMAQVETLTEFYKKLDMIEIDQDAVNAYLKRVADIDMAKYDEYTKLKQNYVNTLNNSIKLEMGRTGATLFGFYNGITHYANHEIKTKDNDSIVTGVGSRMINKVENLMLELV